MYLKFIFAISLMLSSFFCNAQYASTNLIQPTEDNITFVFNKNSNPDDSAFYKDDEGKLVFVDFGKLQYNLKEIVLLNEHNQIMMNDKVDDIPVDAIYEIDFSKLKSGIYSLELRSYTSVIKQDLMLK